MPGADGVPRWSRAVGVAVVDLPDGDGRPAGGTSSPSETPEAGGVVYLAPLPNGPVAVLTGVSAVLYRALVAPDGEPVDHVARALGVPPDEVDPEAVTEFAEELREAGLIVRRP